MKTLYYDSMVSMETSPFWDILTASTPVELYEFGFDEFKMPF